MSGGFRGYAAAALVAVLFVGTVAWGVRTEATKVETLIETPGRTATDDRLVFKTQPVGRGTVVEGCIVCHSVEEGGPPRVAPNLHGIVGAPKAATPWFAYSPGLRAKGGVWTEQDLDAYLSDPDQFAPGTKKTLVGIPDAKQRAAIIAFLKGR